MSQIARKPRRKSAATPIITLVLAALVGTSAWAQAPKEFATVSIRPFQRTRQMAPQPPFQIDPTDFHAWARSLNELVCFTYGIYPFQLTGGGDWTGLSRFNLDATTSGPVNNDQLRAMLREALADRFGLRLKREEKQTPVLALVVAKGGPKLRELQFGEQQSVAPHPPGTLEFHFTTVRDMVTAMDGPTYAVPQALKRPLVNKTGLTGRYDIHLVIPYIQGSVRGRDAYIPQWQNLQGVLKKIGLQLKPLSAPVVFYSIESVHPPTAN